MSTAQPTPTLAMTEFRESLKKFMPGYSWTVHKSRVGGYLQATGTQSSGSNRLSTLEVTRIENERGVTYTAKSAGYGLRARWLHAYSDGTLARALRGLQDHYKRMADTHRSHEQALAHGRTAATGSTA